MSSPVHVVARVPNDGGVRTGVQAVTTTPTALPNLLVSQVTVKALYGNSIPVTLLSSVDEVGFELAPGDGQSLYVSNLNKLRVVASTTGASVCWIAENA